MTERAMLAVAICVIAVLILRAWPNQWSADDRTRWTLGVILLVALLVYLVGWS